MVAAKQKTGGVWRKLRTVETKSFGTWANPNYRRVILSTEMARPRSIDKTGKEPASKQVALRMTEAQYKRLRKRAKSKGKTVAELLRDLAQVA